MLRLRALPGRFKQLAFVAPPCVRVVAGLSHMSLAGEILRAASALTTLTAGSVAMTAAPAIRAGSGRVVDVLQSSMTADASAGGVEFLKAKL